MKTWNLASALEYCFYAEQKISAFAHIGLTGGCLYKQGERKDLDLIIYPHQNVRSFDLTAVPNVLGLTIVTENVEFLEAYSRAVVKCLLPDGRGIDLFFLD